MFRPLVAVMDVAAMQHNLAVVRSCVPKSRIWSVVKANAYGHGLERSVRAFEEADGMALVEIEGAVKLREMGWTKPILILEGFFASEDIHTIVNERLELTIHCNEQIEMLEKTRVSAPLDIHLKMNTGMNRLGFKPKLWRSAYERLRAIPAVRKISFMTHFANAEMLESNPMPFAEQLRRFDNETVELEGERSLSNSAAVLVHPELATDWVRPGIMLYGGTPGGKTAEEYGLKPAMTLKSKIIAIQELDAGESIGYGSRYVADHPIRIGVVACGYADGYQRRSPNGTPILVEGVRTQLLGRVSMDMLTVDLTPVPQAHVGSTVTLWGEGLPIEEVANAAGTVGYELMCALSLRVRVEER